MYSASNSRASVAASSLGAGLIVLHHSVIHDERRHTDNGPTPKLSLSTVRYVR